MTKNSKGMWNIARACISLGILLALISILNKFGFRRYREFREKFIDGPTTDLIISLVIIAVILFGIYCILYSSGIAVPGT